MDAPLWSDTGGRAGTAPTKLHHIFPRNPTQTKFRPCAIHPKRNQPSMCNPFLPISIKPRGVPLPHRGCTFDSEGLASATQPTLGSNASEEATPLGVVLFPPHCFLMSSHTTHRGRKCIAHSRPHSLKQVVYANWHRDDAHLF